jgi:ABC-type branched-subunit amino acid transport system substrate-binding protein
MNRVIYILQIALLLNIFCSVNILSAEQKTIGVIIPQTGPYAHFGDAARIGLEIALKNSKRDFKFVYEDSQYDAAVALRAFSSLRSTSSLAAAFVLGSPPAAAIVPIAKSKNIPIFAWTPSKKISSGSKNFIRLMASADKQASVMAEQVKKDGAKRIAFVIAQNEFAQSIRDSFARNLGTDHLVVNQEFSPAEQDFKSFLLRLKKSQVEAIGICLNTGQIPTFINQLKQAGLDLKIFGCHSMSSQEVAKALRNNSYKAWFVEGSVSSHFSEVFAERSSDSSGIWLAAAFHDMGRLLSDYGLDTRAIFESEILEVTQSAFGKSTLVKTEQEIFLSVPLGISKIENGIIVRAN